MRDFHLPGRSPVFATNGICATSNSLAANTALRILEDGGEERVAGLNGSGHAPHGLNAEALRTEGLTTMPIRDVRAVTVPGAVDAFCRLHEDWGRIGLPRLLAPAIRYAREGVPVGPARRL